MGNPLNRVPLWITVPIMVAIPVLAVALLISTVTLGHARETAEELAARGLERTHQSIRARLDDLLQTPSQMANVAKAQLASGRLTADAQAEWESFVLTQAETFPEVSAFRWVNNEGLFVEARRDDSDKVTLVSKRPEDTDWEDARLRPYYQQRGQNWTEPYVSWDSVKPRLISSFVLRYPQQSNPEGVISVDISYETISKYLEGLSVGENGVTFVLDDFFNLLANSADAPTFDGKEIATGYSSTDIRINEASDKLYGDFFPISKLVKPFTGDIEIDGVAYLMRASRFEHESGLRFISVTLVPRSDFLGRIEEGEQKAFQIAMAAGTVTVVFGILLGLLMVRPVIKLLKHVRRIGQGDLSQTITLSPGPEMEQLANEVNAMTAGLRDRMRLRHSLALAMEVQQSLLPEEDPTVPGLDVSSYSTYCDETGGDYYDFLHIAGVDDNTLAIVVGDVMGHGIAAAMLMASARGILRSRSSEPGSLAELLTHLNSLLAVDTGGERFMTMVLITIDESDNRMRWAAAGHEAPMIYDPANDDFIELVGGGLPLGIVEHETYEEYEAGPLPPDAILLAGTDGVWETQSPDGEFFGIERVQAIIRSNANESSEVIGNLLRDELAKFRGGDALKDDETYVVVKAIGVGAMAGAGV